MVLSSRLRTAHGRMLLATSQAALIAICAHPVGAAAAKPKGEAKPAPKAAPSAGKGATAPAGSASKAIAVVTQSEDKIAAAQSITITSNTTTEGPMLPGGSPILMTATMQRPALIRLQISRDGKDVGTVVTGPTGGCVYDVAGNRYIKTEKGTSSQDTIRRAFAAADAILPPGTLLGMFASVSFLMQNRPLEMPAEPGLKREAADITLKGADVTDVTQSVAHGPSVTIMHVYVNNKTSLPVRLSYGGETGGQGGGILQADFNTFKLGGTLPASTFEFTPPATATAYVPPPPPAMPAMPAPATPNAPNAAPATEPAPK